MYRKKKHLQFNGAVRCVKATRFLCMFARPNFDLVSDAIKDDYEQRECALWINHFPSIHIRGLFDSVNWERARSASCFGDFEKPSNVEKMTNSGRFIIEVNHALIYKRTTDINRGTKDFYLYWAPENYGHLRIFCTVWGVEFIEN